MDLSRIPLFAALKTKMAWLNERQAVLAQNVANADTPDYRASDLKPLDFKSLVSGRAGAPALAVTDPSHIARPVGQGGAFRPEAAKPFEVSLTGNEVSLETEMMKVAQTQASYETAINLYRKQVGLFRIALGKR